MQPYALGKMIFLDPIDNHCVCAFLQNELQKVRQIIFTRAGQSCLHKGFKQNLST